MSSFYAFPSSYVTPRRVIRIKDYAQKIRCTHDSLCSTPNPIVECPGMYRLALGRTGLGLASLNRATLRRTMIGTSKRVHIWVCTSSSLDSLQPFSPLFFPAVLPKKLLLFSFCILYDCRVCCCCHRCKRGCDRNTSCELSVVLNIFEASCTYYPQVHKAVQTFEALTE